MTKDQIKDWGHFYLQLVLTALWNSFCQLAGVVTGAATAQIVTGSPIMAKLGLEGWAATAVGTLLVNIGLKLYANQIPDPKPPSQ